MFFTSNFNFLVRYPSHLLYLILMEGYYLKNLCESTLTVKTFKSRSLLEGFRIALTNAVPGLTEEILSPTATRYTFYTSTNSILEWLEQTSQSFAGISFTYEFIALQPLLAGSYTINAQDGKLGFSYKEDEPNATKSVRDFVDFLIQALNKDPEEMERQYTRELYTEKLNISEIALTLSDSMIAGFKSITLTSPHTESVFTKELPQELFTDFEAHPYAVLKTIIQNMSKSFTLLEALSTSSKSFSIREVASILTHFDLTEEGHSWEGFREDFNLNARLHGFTVAQRKKWHLHPLSMEEMIEMLQNSQNGQYLIERHKINNLDVADCSFIIGLASQCGFLYYENQFYLTVDYDSLY